MSELTVRSPLLHAHTPVPLTAAQRAVVWEICALLDERRVLTDTSDALWIEAGAARLRGPGGRSDNVWLRECLDRLLGVKFSGQDGDDPWGAVLLAEYRISRDVVRLLLPPSAVRALRLPTTFAKIDAETAHRLPPNARTLYGLIADRFRQQKAEWLVSVTDLKAALGIPSASYPDWFAFRRRVLDPSMDAINQFGVCRLSWEPVKLGRSVREVRFRWTLKQAGEAEQTAEETKRHSKARGKRQEAADAPPLVEEPKAKATPETPTVQRWAAAIRKNPALATKWAKLAGERTGMTCGPGNAEEWLPAVADDIAAAGGLVVINTTSS